jgi:hypothetical protein
MSAQTRAAAPSKTGEPAKSAAKPARPKAPKPAPDTMALQLQSPPVNGTFGVIVEETVTPGVGQIRRGEFLKRAVAAVERTADQELAAVGRTSRDCPYLVHWIRFYRNQSAAHIERMIRQYAGLTEAADAATVEAAIVTRVQRAVREWIRTGGRVVDAPPGIDWLGDTDRIDDLRAGLPPGEPLESGVRGRMEQALGHSFEDVRVHTDARSAALASSHSARAFAIGQDIAFADGQYRPGTPRSDLLIAHELAHVVQQRGATEPAGEAAVDTSPAPALEQQANRAALRVLGPGARQAIRAQEDTHADALRQTLGDQETDTGLTTLGGLRLQRCDVSKKPEEPPSDLPAVPESPKPVEHPEPKQPTGSIKLPQLPGPDWRAMQSDDDALIIHGRLAGTKQNQLFLIPAKGLVFEPATPEAAAAVKDAPKTPVAPQAPAPSTAPKLGLVAVGHAGAALASAGEGFGFLIGAGASRSGNPKVLVLESLLWLRSVMEIGEINDAIITHGHQDHVNGLNMFRQGVSGLPALMDGNRVTVPPGSEAAAAGPLRDQLAQGNFTIQVFQSTTTTGPGGQEYTEMETRVRDVVVRGVVRTSRLNEYNRQLRDGNWRKATAVADAASPIYKVTWPDGIEVLSIDDQRIGEVLRIANIMGVPNFRAFMGGARILVGFHHLGATQSQQEVTRFLQMMVEFFEGEPFTVIAQTGRRAEVNAEWVKAINAAGGRVVYVEQEEADAARRGSIEVTYKGDVVGDKARESPVDPVTMKAQKRIETLKRAIRVVEALPEYRQHEELSKSEIKSGLQAEINRLVSALGARVGLVAGRQTNQTQQQLEANLRELESERGMETTLGAAEVQRLAGTRVLPSTLERAAKESWFRGEAVESFTKLLGEVDPGTVSEILRISKDFEGAPRGAQRAYWRDVRARLEEQRETMKALTLRGSAKIPMGGKAFAVVGLALEAWEIAIQPYLEQRMRESDEQSHQDFYTFYNDLFWWYEKGLHPVAIGITGGHEFTSANMGDAGQMKSLFKGIEFRVKGDALPKGKAGDKERGELRKKEGEEKVDPLEQLYIPEMNRWSEERRTEFFTSLLLFTSQHIRNFSDYASEIEETLEHPPLRMPRSSGDKPFGERPWQIRVGSIEGGHVKLHWQDSPDLTRIMNATANRVIATTKKEQTELWTKAPKVNPDDLPAPSGPGASQAPKPGEVKLSRRDAQPTRLLAAKGTPDVYQYQPGTFKTIPIESLSFAGKGDELVFVQFGLRSAPDHYTWVTGGNYDTYVALRNTKIWSYQSEVPIPRFVPVTDPNDVEHFDPTNRKKEEDYLQGDALTAWKAATHDPPLSGVILKNLDRRDPGGDVNEAIVYFYNLVPNVSATVLVKTKDMEILKER